MQCPTSFFISRSSLLPCFSLDVDIRSANVHIQTFTKTRKKICSNFRINALTLPAVSATSKIILYKLYEPVTSSSRRMNHYLHISRRFSNNGRAFDEHRRNFVTFALQRSDNASRMFLHNSNGNFLSHFRYDP